VWNFAEIYAALDDASGAELVDDVGRLTVRVGALLHDPDQRAGVVEAARATVAMLGGALERTLAAIDPYLMAINLERQGSGEGSRVEDAADDDAQAREARETHA
jgi:3-deoxy-D-manno-octulosonic-acid transferase